MAYNKGKNGAVKTAKTISGIIETLDDVEEATLTEIAEELDIPRSTLHPHLSTLTDQGYLVKRDKRYSLSLQFLGFGARVQRRHPLYEISDPMLKQVADQTKEITWLVVEENGKAVCLKKAKGELAIQPYKQIGARLTMHDIAAGKAILAYLPSERVDSILDNHGLPKRTGNTITNRDELYSELEKIRETGVAFNDGESMEGFRAVASPIRPEGNLYGSIVVSGPKNRMRKQRFKEEIPDIVSGAANAIELELMAG
jgi:IclR family transcriptional regulator, acetate operon repressor